MQFLELEGGYLAIATFILIVTLFVTTRPFMGQNSLKYGLSGIFLVLSIAIISHYIITINRMNDVQAAFLSGKNVICESKAVRKVSQSLVINKKLGWTIKEDIFISSEYERGFHTARCIVE
ncbi:MAG: hypothetical protein ACO29X_06095 [Arcobacteraceae bacterium]|jgi:hypothetical protein